MKKAALLICLAALFAGCDDTVSELAGCGHGNMNDVGICVCDKGYQQDLNGKCTVCADGYTSVNDKCVMDGEDPGDNPGDNPGVDSDKCITTFQYYNEYTSVASGGEAEFDVYLVGEFNDWKAPDEKYKMTADGKGNHTIRVEWEKGSVYKYKYYINNWGENSWQQEPATTEYDNDGNATANISACGLTFGKTNSSGGSGDTGGDTGGGNTPVVVPNVGGNLAAIPTVEGKKITFSVDLDEGYKIAGVTGGVTPTFEGTTVTDTVTENNRYNYRVQLTKDGTNSELYVPVWVEDKDFDWHDALLYFAFTDRFVDGDPSNNAPVTDASNSGTADARWMGGDFKGLKSKVDEGYFDALGVNTLWISSVSMNAQGISWGTNEDAAHSYSAYHSYWPVASFMTDANQAEFSGATSENIPIQAIEPHFGNIDDLTALVDSCHKRGIRVLIDFAANHVHRDSPIYKKHADWFNGNENDAWVCNDNDGWNQAPETCWFSKDLPDINYNNADARRTMVDHAVWLIKKTGVDGFRVDAVKHMAIQFIRDLRAATDSVFANTGITFYMVGETFDGDPGKLNKYIGNDLLHAQFDFQLYFQMNNLLKGQGMYSVATSGMYGAQNPYNSDLMGTFIGNHDVARALSVAAGQNTNKWGNNTEVTAWEPYFRVKQALTILLTNPGVPLIYYGDEYGMEGANDPDNRRMMKFGDSLNEQQKIMLDYVQKLGKIRAGHSAITRGKRENLTLEDKKWCYKLSDGAETVLVGVASLDAGGTCSLGGNYNVVDLLNEGTESKTVSELNFEQDKFQIYLVK